MTVIYGLLDEAGRIRYVGRTSQPRARMAGHRSNWRLGKLSFEPCDMRPLETCSRKSANRRERYWIQRLPGLTNKVCTNNGLFTNFQLRLDTKTLRAWRMAAKARGVPLAVLIRKLMDGLVAA